MEYIIKRLFCRHKELELIRTVEPKYENGKIAFKRSKYKCKNCGKIIIKMEDR